MKKTILMLTIFSSIFLSPVVLSEDSSIIDKNSLKTFFNEFGLTNYDSPLNQNSNRGFARYNWSEWYGKYYRAHFHRAIAFAYPENNIKSAEFSGFCMHYQNPDRNDAEVSALNCCELKKDKLHTCSILFRNSHILNKDYLAILNQ